MSRLTRFVNLWRGRSLDAEFDEELRFHLDMRIASNLRAGLSPDDAEAEARRHLGARCRAKEGMREARVMTWIETLVRDGWLRHSPVPATTGTDGAGGAHAVTGHRRQCGHLFAAARDAPAAASVSGRRPPGGRRRSDPGPMRRGISRRPFRKSSTFAPRPRSSRPSRSTTCGMCRFMAGPSQPAHSPAASKPGFSAPSACNPRLAGCSRLTITSPAAIGSSS